MWTVPKPVFDARGTFEICIEGIQDAGKKARLEGIRVQIEDAESAFDERAAATELHIIPEVNEIAGIGGNVTAKEMEQLYDRHMARQKGRGRAIYDKLMLAAVHGQCPFCGHLPVSTLDHSLPKARHPTLAVTPFNLIPCCKDCNHNKGTLGPDEADRQFLHAYYDDLTVDRWLSAEIIEGSPPGAVFSVVPPIQWDDQTSSRVQWHFQQLKLGSLYASQAGRQLQNIRNALTNIFDAAGAVAVSDDLVQRSQSCAAVSVNSWEGALYEAASQSNWYCNRGFAA
ncbi:hypothetical protein [uncultured Sneathiella sp.]|jgi:5-methylcytosine-specific restriction endonuclease McrA|uniref:HNH endonuclease n=1 Tax=uncultured Sneathiella sp. TaxID=879315 RepID=UPI0030DA90BC|tara:strand:- start:2022 stop:2873 length:852 start_codon:yes stop_codon:yes gene_type:complete